MAFRADESARNGLESVMSYFLNKSISAEEKIRSREKLYEIVEKYGPVIDAYPSWHPLVANYDDVRCPTRLPSDRCGYKGLDHTRYFQNAFITCPYDDGQKIIESVNELILKYHNHLSFISVEKLDVQLYHPEATPILVTCNWEDEYNVSGTIPASIVVPLILKQEMRAWKYAQVAETWESMRPYFLGSPHGSQSSLFIAQETGVQIKKIWNLLINTGMFGPIKVD